MNPWTVRVDYGLAELALRFPLPDQHRPEGPVLLAVDQELDEGTGLVIPPELSDPVGTIEVGEDEDVEKLGAGTRTESVESLVQYSFELREIHEGER
jgi:hypothetical protein